MKDRSYERFGSGSGDDWMAQDRRYEAKHSPWELDDNAAYLDEEHRRHCEAREARRAHERECEVKRPGQENLQNLMTSQLKEVRKTVSQARRSTSAVNPVAIFFTIFAIMIFMMIISVFIGIITSF